VSLWDDHDDVPFTAVRNAEGHRSVWPTSQPVPAGWTAIGAPAGYTACLAAIDRVPDALVRTTAPPLGVRAAGGDPDPARSVRTGPLRPAPVPSMPELIARADLPGAAVALRCGSVRLTRAELFDTARRWASALVARGCAAEVPVAVLLPRGADAITAILAVLHAGGGFVPLRPADPPDRLAAVLADCGHPLVITDDTGRARLAGYPGAVVTPAELRGSPPLARPAPVAADDLAFVFYTSGTTGRPKGVEGTHRQLVNYALWCRDAFPHRPGEWTVLHASLSFLGSLTTIFTPLLAGWPIQVAPEDATVDDLLALVRDLPVGLLKLTPTHLRMMHARGAAGRRLARQYMIGSEPLVLTEELAGWVAAEPDAVFVNHYGLTETHGCFCHPFRADQPVGGTVPIGAPITNVRAHVVDRHGADLPLGAVGELLVAGDSIGRGYRGRPGLTAQRWIPDRHGPPGSRALRTGDLARLRPDGAVELLGRVDRQVKVRGHRVEPGEVEHALRQRPDVLAALVLPVPLDGAPTLAAYLVPRPGHAPDPLAVHRDLAARLPAPAVPARIAVLAEFPVNANGKVDVSALPEAAPVAAAGAPPTDPVTVTAVGAPPADPVTVTATGARPADPVAEVVADAFAAALGVAEVGPRDGFFDLGGDSLSAVQVAVAVGGRLGGEVPVPTPDCATVRDYALVVTQALGQVGEDR
jgi:amino acid adenylation domain-containing protein